MGFRSVNSFIKYTLCIVLTLYGIVSKAAQNTDTIPPQISLITCGPGEGLAELFGHTAIRVNRGKNNDIIFNYGMYDSYEDNFAINFVKGNTYYKCGIQPFDRFLYSYQYYGRWVKEQVLDITPSEAYKLEAFLRNNALPQNRTYLYNFFYDNCSNRVKDIFEDQFPSYSFTDSPIKTTTYRQLLDEYLVNKDWTDFGIDIIIGSPGDEVIDHHGQMFLPDYLMTYVDRFKSGNRSIIKSTRVLLDIPPLKSKSFWITPFILFGFLLIIECLLFIGRKESAHWSIKWYDTTWIVIVSLASALLLFMLTTKHTACHANYNLLWISPLFILLLLSRLFKQSQWTRLVGMCILGTLVISLLAAPMITQVYPAVGYIIIGILFLKVLRITYLSSQAA